MAKSDDVGFHSLVLVLGCCWLVVIDRASGMQRRSARTCKPRPPVAGGTLHRSTALCASSDRAKSDVFLDF